MRCVAVSLAVSLQAISSLGCVVGPRDNQSLLTWWHEKPSVNTNGPVAADEVRQSRKYDVSVRLAGKQEWQDSFVYETIPRNGNGRMYDPANPGQEYNLADGDGITVELDAGINMAWTQFEYSEAVEVRITSKDGSAQLGPASNVVIRPTDTRYEITSPDSNTVVVKVPYDAAGRRFSVEFQNDLFEYRSDGRSYIESGGLLVSREPRNALVIFASAPIPNNLIPSKTSSDVQVLKPGKITDSTIEPKATLYFEAGTYWLENNGHLGKSHIKLDPNTHFVYLAPGAYIKGAFEYTTTKDFFTIGHGVVSGENYAYMANTDRGYVAEKDDRKSLRIFSHQSVDEQKWTAVGVTVNAPPFNTVDLFPRNHTPHEEDNKVRSDISDYKQVGAFYFQTDGPQIYAGTTKNGFWHVNDDAIKLYHSNAKVQDVTIWKCHNDPVIQMGWKPRGVSGVTVSGLKVIHTRWFKSETVVPSSIIGASPYYSDPKLVDAGRTITVTISDLRCEGSCPALLRIAPLQNYDLTIENVKYDDILRHDIKLGQSLVGMKIGNDEDAYTPGQDQLRFGMKLRNWQIGGQKVDSSNWQSGQLGQLNVHPDYWGDWSIA